MGTLKGWVPKGSLLLEMPPHPQHLGNGAALTWNLGTEQGQNPQDPAIQRSRRGSEGKLNARSRMRIELLESPMSIIHIVGERVLEQEHSWKGALHKANPGSISGIP